MRGSKRSEKLKTNLSPLRAPLYMEHLDGPFSLAALPYSQMNELLNRTGDRMYSRPNDPPPPPPLMHPLGEIKPPSVIRWESKTTHNLFMENYLGRVFPPVPDSEASHSPFPSSVGCLFFLKPFFVSFGSSDSTEWHSITCLFCEFCL